MRNREIVEVKADLDDLLFMFGSALRYGLGRQSYAPGLIIGVIKDNFALLNEKWIVNMLRDLRDYKKDRITWNYKDDHHYEAWLDLERQLMDLYKERGFSRPID